ncbi:MAG TPA: metal-dependent hydrolase [Blastocatellia bacterium]|nr:metal-dependent hydrolase [Blastocatellia bacterium]
MCSAFTHPAIPLALAVFLPKETVSPTLVVIGAACSIVPDLDAIGFRLGVSYGDMFGHRGFTHSIVFAAALSALLTFTLFRHLATGNWLVFVFLFVATLSHPLLDMLTNGGLGIALFAPFSNQRYFFPSRPIEVSPIGVASFFSTWGIRVLLSELQWVWLPAAGVFAVGYIIRRYR